MTKSDRTTRLLQRNLAKVSRELRNEVQNHKSFKKMALAAKKAYEKRQKEDAEILANSLRNFSGPLYKLKNERKKLLKMNEDLHKEVRSLREIQHRNLISLRQAAQNAMKYRKKASKSFGKKKMMGQYVVKGSMDI